MTGSQTRVLASFLGALVVASIVGAALFALRGEGGPRAADECLDPRSAPASAERFDAPPCMFIDPDTPVIARLDTSMGTIRLILDPNLAARTVNNFVFLARRGFFDGTIFHRVENDRDHAIVQGGDPTGTGRGGPGYTYDGEEPSPITQYRRGFVAMANTGDPSSNASQFFIVVRDWEALGAPNALPRYTFFGVVADEAGYAVLDRIVKVPRRGTRPITDVVLERVAIESLPPEE